jgi:TonB family protein
VIDEVKAQKGFVIAVRRRTIFVPKGFPEGRGTPRGNFKTTRTVQGRLSGPIGAFALHASLIFMLVHSDAMREGFGPRMKDDTEWVWLPEVSIVPERQSSPLQPETPPEPEKPEAPTPPPPAPEVAPESPVMAEPAPKEILQAFSEELEPEPQPEEIEEPAPQPPRMVADNATPDLWTKVREDIMKSLRYPAHARRSGITGVVNILLKLDGTGRIVSAEITPPAPAKSLCDAVLSSVHRAGPFPNLGEAIRQGQSPAVAEISIRFELEAAGL